ncbi:hypothetical protein E2562_003889, partial [Oryza meyeriana var. granulata]
MGDTAVLVAADCNPKWLTKHIPTLASTRQVPVLCLKDNKESSLRLGQVVDVRTALAIGVKSTTLLTQLRRNQR